MSEIAAKLKIDLATVLTTAQVNLGRIFFVAELPNEGMLISPIEVVRWPSHRHAISSSYWNNSVDVRKGITSLAVATEKTAFLRSLCELHRLQMIGSSGESFYYPRSVHNNDNRIAVMPGVIRPKRDVICASGTPAQERGYCYIEMLEEQLGGDRRGPNSPLISDEGVLYGESRWTWMAKELGPRAHLYCATPAVTVAQMEGLFRATRELFDASESGGEQGSFFSKAATFVQTFVALHPFTFGNMSLAMNILNACLRRRLNGYVMHAELDWVAQRLTYAQFKTYMAKYLETYLIRPDTKGAMEHVIVAALKLRECFKLKDSQALKAWRDRDVSHRKAAMLA